MQLLTYCLVQEGGRTPPPHPSIFIKASTCIAGFNEEVPIPKLAQDTVDYEGELVSNLRDN
jgi:2-keto-4-pentenoate hydratase/2-oxohepta-3-ene-1,7-dioic acid hydratase in catechol pathway